MKTIAFLLPFAIATGGCMTAGEEREPAIPGETQGGECNADRVQKYIGQEVSDALGEAIQRESGAKTLRWGAPNSAWTMDYRTDRVNVRYDENRLILDITCG